MKFIERKVRRMGGGRFREFATVKIEASDIVCFAKDHQPIDEYGMKRLLEEHPTLKVTRHCYKDGRPMTDAMDWHVEAGVTCCGPYSLYVVHLGEEYHSPWRASRGDKRVWRRKYRRVNVNRSEPREIEYRGPYVSPKMASEALNKGLKTSRWYEKSTEA